MKSVLHFSEDIEDIRSGEEQILSCLESKQHMRRIYACVTVRLKMKSVMNVHLAFKHSVNLYSDFCINPAGMLPSCSIPFLIQQSLPLPVKSPSRPLPFSSRCSLNGALMSYVRFHHLLSEVTFFLITPSNYITDRHSHLPT